MLHINAAMTAPYDEETGLADLDLEFAKPAHLKRRGRAPSDDLSTAAPSPEASPTLGPQHNTPFLGPEDLDLPDADLFQLPDAQDSLSSSDADFELAGFDDDDELSSKEFELTGLDDVKDSRLELDFFVGGRSYDDGESSEASEDAESELLDLLTQLSALRAESRQQQQLNGSDSGMMKIPYPKLEAGFIPTSLMPANSWLLPAGVAQTGKWACAMAPRPGDFDSMEPLNIVLGTAGVTLEIGSDMPEDYLSECERRRSDQAKAVFRRRRGRSRSPLVSMDDMEHRGVPEGSPRGRPRLWTR